MSYFIQLYYTTLHHILHHSNGGVIRKEKRNIYILSSVRKNVNVMLKKGTALDEEIGENKAAKDGNFAKLHNIPVLYVGYNLLLYVMNFRKAQSSQKKVVGTFLTLARANLNRKKPSVRLRLVATQPPLSFSLSHSLSLFLSRSLFLPVSRLFFTSSPSKFLFPREKY